jgi:hypothetical protein
MTRTPFLLAVLLAFAGSASAQAPRVVKILEQSYELDLADVALPPDGIGTITVAPCASCTRVAHPATSSTAYLLNATPVPFADFIKAAHDRRRMARSTFVGVYYDIESKRVNRVLMKTQ